MTTREVTCLVITCDDCTTEIQIEDSTAHFSSREEAQRLNESWTLAETGDLCPECRCKRDGHKWEEPFFRDDRVPVGVAWCEQCRCSRYVNRGGQGISDEEAQRLHESGES